MLGTGKTGAHRKRKSKNTTISVVVLIGSNPTKKK
jgi:hypothetical protein